MKILFIGSNGNISWYCVKKALSDGHEVWAINRKLNSKTRRNILPEVKVIVSDISDTEYIKKQISGLHFDCVCDFICYNEKNAFDMVELFYEKTDQFIFISSESVYSRLDICYPISENSKRYSVTEVEGYIKGKICAENVFISEYKNKNFPVTIVRPGYTYDTIMPASLGYNCFTIADNAINNHIAFVMEEGNNLWNPLHSLDFASAFIGLIGNKETIGNEYNITGDNLISLNDMTRIMLSSLNIDADIVNVSCKDLIDANLIKDSFICYQQCKDYIFDNSAIKKVVSGWKQNILFDEGMKMTARWFLEDKNRQRINIELKNKLNDFSKKYKEFI